MIICPNPIMTYLMRKLRLAELCKELRDAIREGNIEKTQAVVAEMIALQQPFKEHGAVIC